MPRLRRWQCALPVLLLALLVLLPGAVAAVDLDRLFERRANPFLQAEQAFPLEIEAPAADRLIVRWQVQSGYYLYRHAFAFMLQPADADAAPIDLLAGGRVRLPAGTPKDDPYFGRTAVYTEPVSAELELPTRTGTLTVRWQGCAERGICYPPAERVLDLADWLPAATASASAPPAARPPAAARAPAAQPPSPAASSRLARLLEAGSLGPILLTFFGLGLLLAFTPCVLPMVPILSAVIIGEQAGRGRAFALSAAYVLAMALTYTAAGILAGLFGANLQAYAQHPAVLIGFSAIFVLLALGLLGLYTIQLPSRLAGRLQQLSARQRGGSYLGVGVMGALSALIVGPCVAAPLAGALVYIGQTGDALLGGSALFALSLGMGAPLLLVGLGAGALLPRAGQWMAAIESLFGLLLLGVALWLLGRLLPGWASVAAWGGLAILTAVLAGALTPGMTRVGRLRQGLALVLLAWGLIWLLAGARGGDRLWPPLALPAGQQTGAAKVAFRPVASVAELEQALAAAREAGQPVVLDFYADWCVDCVRMARSTFRDPQVIARLAPLARLQADVTANDAEDRALLRALGVPGPPALLIFGADGRERSDHRLYGYAGPDAFLRRLELALSESP
ncbi:MAG: protein-disulfide reductase DsbD [Pseudomonadota bacterium]|nr:protein-disulfide reductase DsbD [Pseudomonadota bacterium]